MKLLLLCLTPFLLFAKVHYAKVEPFETLVLKSSVSALVEDVRKDAEGTFVKDKRIIYLDDKIDIINLEASKKSVILLEEMLDINKDTAKTLANTVARQEGYFKRINKLSTASKTQKDSAFSAFSAAKTQYLGTKEKIVNLQKQILDMRYKVTQLEDLIDKKSLILKDKYLYKLLVNKGDFVAPGTALAQVMDESRAKLVLFLEPEELRDIYKQIVYLDGKKTKYKVDKVWRMTDEKFISSYRAEIYIDAPKGAFSKLVKVDLKND